MEEFEQEDGISLIDILKVMFGRKILLLIITAIVGIVGTIGILFIYNNFHIAEYSEQLNFHFLINYWKQLRYIIRPSLITTKTRSQVKTGKK